MNPDAPIIYFNRHSGQEETELVLGEKAIRNTYGTTWGRLALHLLIKRAFFSKWYGARMDTPESAKRIPAFIEQFGIDQEEALIPEGGYKSFNDFFFRRLKPEARPLDENPDHAVFPADGRHSGFANASQTEGVFIKGQSFDLPALLGDAALGERYAQGTLIISRLCPVDYHRFHFPVEGTPGETKTIPGPLASVSPYALRRKLSWLWTNKRTLTLLDSPRWGKVALIDVGATCVGSIFQTFTPGQAVQKGDEKGYFAFGGSTVITLFEPGRIRLAQDLLDCTARQQELYARVGSCMGETPHPTN